MRLKTLAKTGLLLTIKESYLLSKNTFGLGVHPIKTLRSLQREKDRSQQLLLIGMPLWVFGFGLFFTYLGRRLLSTSSDWGFGAKISLVAAVIVTTFISGYLGYWFYKLKRWQDER